MEGIGSITIIIIVLTCIVSFIGFGDRGIFDRLKFNVDAILHQKQWDRMITSALLHADMLHLFFNMFTLYMFSNILISEVGSKNYLVIYIAAILCGGFLSLWMHRKNPFYSAIGASGGVTGIVFATIAIYPEIGIGFFFIPLPIPGWIFAIIYLGISIYGMKNQLGNIGHDAHLGGAVAGLVLALIFVPGSLQANLLFIGIMCIPIVVLAYYVYKERNL